MTVDIKVDIDSMGELTAKLDDTLNLRKRRFFVSLAPSREALEVSNMNRYRMNTYTMLSLNESVNSSVALGCPNPYQAIALFGF